MLEEFTGRKPCIHPKRIGSDPLFLRHGSFDYRSRVGSGVPRLPGPTRIKRASSRANPRFPSPATSVTILDPPKWPNSPFVVLIFWVFASTSPSLMYFWEEVDPLQIRERSLSPPSTVGFLNTTCYPNWWMSACWSIRRTHGARIRIKIATCYLPMGLFLPRSGIKIATVCQIVAVSFYSGFIFLNRLIRSAELRYAHNFLQTPSSPQRRRWYDCCPVASSPTYKSPSLSFLIRLRLIRFNATSIHSEQVTSYIMLTLELKPKT